MRRPWGVGPRRSEVGTSKVSAAGVGCGWGGSTGSFLCKYFVLACGLRDGSLFRQYILQRFFVGGMWGTGFQGFRGIWGFS